MDFTVPQLILRLYLLAGLIAHKAVWEVLKRSSAHGAFARSSSSKRLLKAVKIAALAAIIAQTLLPEILPIAENAYWIRSAGLLFFTAGLAMAVSARIQLGANWSDIEDGRVVARHTIVTGGIYKYIRHPIYTGDILLLFGIELALNSWLILGVPGVILFVVHRVTKEEDSLSQQFPGYRNYLQSSKRFVPFVY